ncbi:unnamed protein product [Larinioides sclopetarius]|uniref:Uncharacterized protein n=1 Tax=Larinioides sclopetarius TaxID=280406 RepID=A0AAV2AEB9_9ARAC
MIRLPEKFWISSLSMTPRTPNHLPPKSLYI